MSCLKRKQIKEVDRNIYDFKKKDDYDYKIKKGLTKEIVEEISRQKNDPDWMREFRLKAYDAFLKLNNPSWGPDLSGIDFNEEHLKNKDNTH